MGIGEFRIFRTADKGLIEGREVGEAYDRVDLWLCLESWAELEKRERGSKNSVDKESHSSQFVVCIKNNPQRVCL